MHAMGGYDTDKAKKMIGLTDEDYQIEAMIAIGNPTATTASEDTTSRHDIDKFVSEGVFKEKL